MDFLYVCPFGNLHGLQSLRKLVPAWRFDGPDLIWLLPRPTRFHVAFLCASLAILQRRIQGEDFIFGSVSGGLPDHPSLFIHIPIAIAIGFSESLRPLQTPQRSLDNVIWWSDPRLCSFFCRCGRPTPLHFYEEKVSFPPLISNSSPLDR